MDKEGIRKRGNLEGRKKSQKKLNKHKNRKLACFGGKVYSFPAKIEIGSQSAFLI